MEKDQEERKGKQKKKKEGEEVRKMRLQAEIRKEELLKNNKLQDVRVSYVLYSTLMLSLIQITSGKQNQVPFCFEIH